MVIETVPEFIYLCLALYGAASLGYAFNRFVNN